MIIAQIVHPEEMKNYKTPESLDKEITNRARKSCLLKTPNIPKGCEKIELKRRFLCLGFICFQQYSHVSLMTQP